MQAVRARVQFPRQLRFTRDGKYFVLLTLGVGFAAINTANNLLYLVLGMQLALIIVSGVMSEVSLRDLVVSRRLPVRAQAERAHLVEIEIRNKKSKIPSYAIEVEDIRAGHPTDKRCFFLKIAPKSVQVAAYRRTPHRRGRDQHTGFRIATRFPFGLFEKSVRYAVVEELVIYPAVDPVRPSVMIDVQTSDRAEQQSRGNGHEVIGLRPMRTGDDPRDVYWRKSTIPNQMVLKERARETRPNASLSLDDVLPLKANKDMWCASFERRIRETASMAVAHLRNGCDVKLFTNSGRVSLATAASGPDPLLRFLALVEPTREEEVKPVVTPLSPPPKSEEASLPGLGRPERAVPETGSDA